MEEEKILGYYPPSKKSWKTLVTTPPRKFLENCRYYPPSKFLGKFLLLLSPPPPVVSFSPPTARGVD